MKFYGHIDLNDNEIQKAVLESEDNFPTNPTVGRVIFREKRVFIATEYDGGNAIWVPITNTINTHVHRQDTASTTWTITHNLNTTTPMVNVYSDSSNAVFVPDNITIVDNNSFTVTVGTAITGRCVVMSGELTGAAQPAYSYLHTQTSSSTSWVIAHALGYEPIVRVFIGNQEVYPDTITHDTVNQVTLTFSSPVVGTARLI